MTEQKNKRSRVMGGAEDEIIDERPSELSDPGLSSRAKDEVFADSPPVQTQTPDPGPRVEAPDTTPPQRHDSGGPYEEGAADATFFKADYSAEETNRKDGSA